LNHVVSRLEYRNKRYAYSHYTHAKAGRGSVWPFDVRRAVDRFFRLIGKCPDTGIDDILSHKEKMETHALRLIDSDTFIGWITLQRDHEQRPDIGILITADYQNEGYGPEAVTLFVNRLWSEPHLCPYFSIKFAKPASVFETRSNTGFSCALSGYGGTSPTVSRRCVRRSSAGAFLSYGSSDYRKVML